MACEPNTPDNDQPQIGHKQRSSADEAFNLSAAKGRLVRLAPARACTHELGLGFFEGVSG